MNLKVTQENLNRALSSVAKVANTQGTLPILSNVLLKTDKNRLSLAATNLDIAITHYIGSKISSEGSITVPARLMQDFISNIQPGTINLDLDGDKLHISTEQYNSTINGIVADDFPTMPTIEGGKTWTVNSGDFKKAMQQVVLAASSDETRPVLTGVLIYTNEGKLYAASTDSYRLAEKQIGTNNQDINLLIPATAINDLMRIIDEGKEELKITHNDQQALFQTGDTELVTRLIDGKYPNYRKLIPEKFTNQATLEKSELLNIAKVSSLFARENAGSVTVTVNKEKNELNIGAAASQLGENTATAHGKVSGEGSVTINSRYLIDALGVISGEKVTFGFNGKLEPTLLKDPNSPDYQHLIMPLKS